jgi:rhodanese-related sulfurtransferase
MTPAPLRFSAALLVFAFISCTPRSSAPTWSRIKHQIQQEFPDVQQMSIEELKTVKTEELLLIDVRSRDEYEMSCIEGAKHAAHARDVQTLIRESAKPVIVLYCSVGYRSSKMIVSLPVPDARVHNLEGSIFQWANEGNPVYSASKAVEHVHPFDDKWGVLLNTELHPEK